MPERTPQISASLLAADYARLGEEVTLADHAGVDSFHFDMMDGHYVPNLALAPDHLSALRAYSQRPFHVHLELSNPDEILEHFHNLRADLIIACWDTLTHPHETFMHIRSLGAKVGLSFGPNESAEEAISHFPDLDLLLILGVSPGYGGQAMHANTLSRISQARELRDRMAFPPVIAVDGGVNLKNAQGLVRAGAEILIIGTALFKARQMAKFIADLKASVES